MYAKFISCVLKEYIQTHYEGDETLQWGIKNKTYIFHAFRTMDANISS